MTNQIQGYILTGCCPNHFSLALKHFLINLRLIPEDSKTRPSGSNSRNRLFFHFTKIYEQKTYQKALKKIFGWVTAR